MSTKPSVTNAPPVEPVEENDSEKPDFIYGGPFVKVDKPDPFLNTATPWNLQLQGSFKKSFAYYSLKERFPVILTKIIDYLSRQGNQIKSAHGANDEDIRQYIQYITKLKNDLVTNKRYDLLTVDTAEARRWNDWILAQENATYFTNTWVFSECYVYRRLREGCELSKGLKNFDPFDEQKDQSFSNSLEVMCLVAARLFTMLQPAEKDKRRADFITLLKIALWANKCDLSLTMGELVTLGSGKVLDPFQMILDLKDKILVDDSAKAADQVFIKAEAMKKAVEAASATPPACPPPGDTDAAAAEEPPRVPCPAKVTVPSAVMFDIVCDNSGYELFSDLCIADFLVSQGVVTKVRFHVKNIPWFVSDVTPRDFKYVIESCRKASYSREIPPETKAEAAEGEAPPEPRVITAESLQRLGERWNSYLDDGTFILMHDDFWTSPHVYKDMKKYDINLYRKLQLAAAVLFKGDLNYRKLLGERNCNPVLGFEAALQGFTPAPLIALRTVKADLICGLPKGKWDALTQLDDKWMQTGDYGVIQFSGRAEAPRAAEAPCADYGLGCRGGGCPHTHGM